MSGPASTPTAPSDDGVSSSPEFDLKCKSLARCRGPSDQWRVAEDRAAAAGNSLSYWAAVELGVSQRFLDLWFSGIDLECQHLPPHAILDNYPSVQHDAATAGEELDRLTKLGKIHWYGSPEEAPPDLNVCPSQLIIKPSKVRLVHDWSCRDYSLNSLLPNPPVDYGAIDGFLRLLRPGAFMAGLDFQDCFLHWLVRPVCRRWLGIRHPMSNRLGCYLFLPFGLGPSPGWNDACVKEVLRVLQPVVPRLRFIDFVDDIRMTHDSGEEQPLAHDLNSSRHVLDFLGIRVHTRPGKLILPTQSIPWLGFITDTLSMELQIAPDKKKKGLSLISDTLALQNMPARELLQTISFLNFLEWVVPGGFAHLRAGWDIINESGVMRDWAEGRRTNPAVYLPPVLRNDLHWWRTALESDPVKPIHYSADSCFVWHPRLPDLKSRILAQNPSELNVWYTDASGSIGWGATFNDLFIQGTWEPGQMEEHINWKELFVVTHCLRHWGSLVQGQAVLVRMDNTTAIHYVNYGSGRIPPLTALARSIKAEEAHLRCLLLGLHVRGTENQLADALSLYRVAMCRLDPFPERRLRSEWFSRIRRTCGDFDVDMMASADGHNALCDAYCSPANSAFELPLLVENQWWFPPTDVVELALRHILDARKRGWQGAASILIPDPAVRRWHKLTRDFSKALIIPPGARAFLLREESDPGRLRILDHEDKHSWVVLHTPYPVGTGDFLPSPTCA